MFNKSPFQFHRLGSSSMRVLGTIVLSLVTATGVSENSQNKAVWSVPLTRYGWVRPKVESNPEFFKDFTLAKLAAVDPNTRILFVGEHVIVVYHTIEGRDWKDKSRTLGAFIVRAEDGTLIRRMTWTTRTRKSGSDLLDSEARIMQLSGDRFLVVANGVLLLYADDGKLLQQKNLHPFDAGDLWAVQAVSDGQAVFLRHQSALARRSTYYWLALDSLSLTTHMAGFYGGDYSVGVTAGYNFVLAGSRDTGVRMIKLDGSEETICEAPLCRADHTLCLLDQHRIGISGRQGFGLLDVDKGIEWSKEVESAAQQKQIQTGDMRWAISGQAFGIWLTAIRSQTFEGITLDQSPNVLVYRPGLPSHVFAVKVNPSDFDFDFALSPSGALFAVFDGSNLRMYRVP